MNNKKTWLVIVIIFVAIGSGVGVYFWNNSKKTMQNNTITTNTNHQPNTLQTTPHVTNESDQLEENQNEQEQTKFQITQVNFDKIKDYVLLVSDDKTLLPTNLSEKAKNKIETAKECHKNNLEILVRRKAKIVQLQKECDGYQNQIQLSQTKFDELSTQLTPIKQELEQKKQEKELKRAQRRQATPQNKTHLQTELDALSQQILDLAGQFGKVELEIKNLEADKKMYEGMLKRANQLKETLEREYNKKEKDFREQAISSLNFYFVINS